MIITKFKTQSTPKCSVLRSHGLSNLASGCLLQTAIAARGVRRTLASMSNPPSTCYKLRKYPSILLEAYEYVVAARLVAEEVESGGTR